MGLSRVLRPPSQPVSGACWFSEWLLPPRALPVESSPHFCTPWPAPKRTKQKLPVLFRPQTGRAWVHPQVSRSKQVAAGPAQIDLEGKPSLPLDERGGSRHTARGYLGWEGLRKLSLEMSYQRDSSPFFNEGAWILRGLGFGPAGVPRSAPEPNSAARGGRMC